MSPLSMVHWTSLNREPTHPVLTSGGCSREAGGTHPTRIPSCFISNALCLWGDVHTFQTKLNADMLLPNHARDVYFDRLNFTRLIYLLD